MSETTLDKQSALQLLEEFSEFTKGMDDEIDDKVDQLRGFIEAKFGKLGEYTFKELLESAPEGVYATASGMQRSSRLIVLDNHDSNFRAVLFCEKGVPLQTAEQSSWCNYSFKLMEDEVIRASIEAVPKEKVTN